MTRSIPRTIIAIMVTLTALAATGCAPLSPSRQVSVLASWLGQEEVGFRQVLKAFQDKSGIVVNYRGTRALTEALQSNLRRGTPPDIAILPGIGELAQYAHNGDLQPLNEVIGTLQKEYDRQWLLPQKEQIYTVPIKVNLKSIIWYNPSRFSNPPGTWDELVNRSRAIAAEGRTPWCMGMFDPTSPGWPGTDWIEDILLHQSGPDVYRQWAAGELAWTSDPVRRAWTTWGQITKERNLVHGGTRGALVTDFGDAGRAMFANPPGCLLEHQASFIVENYQGASYAFFPFPRFGGASGGAPGGQVMEVSADLAGMFNDTPEARELMRYLASGEAQRIWPAPQRGSFSVNKKVDPSVHGTDPIGDQIARTLRGASTVCLDASDLMPAAVRDAFNSAALEYLNDPGHLDALLGELDRVRKLAKGADWVNLECVRQASL